jgi:hypothetical protein
VSDNSSAIYLCHGITRVSDRQRPTLLLRKYQRIADHSNPWANHRSARASTQERRRRAI